MITRRLINPKGVGDENKNVDFGASDGDCC